MLKNKNEQLTSFGPNWSQLNLDNDWETKRDSVMLEKWQGGEC